MKKGWFSEEAFALVREMAFAKCKNSEIAAAASTRFHTLVTDGMVADRLQRDAIGIELNPTYCAMAEHRLHKDAGLFAEISR